MSTARVAASIAPSAFAGFQFPPEVITLAVRWYLRFGISYRDLEELLAERGVEVDHVSIFRWVRFTPLLTQGRHARASTVSGIAAGSMRLTSKCPVGGAMSTRAIDQFRQVINVYVATRRDGDAARCFFTRALATTRVIPVEVTTD